MGAACPSGRREPRSHSCRDPGQSASSVGLGTPAVGLGVAQGKARGGPSAVNSLWVAPGTARKVAPPRPGAPPPKCGASLQVPAGRRGCPPIRRWGGRRPRAWFVPGAHLPARPRSPETPGSEAAVSMPAAQGGTEARGAVRLPAATRFRRCGWVLIEVSFLEILAASRCKERQAVGTALGLAEGWEHSPSAPRHTLACWDPPRPAALAPPVTCPHSGHRRCPGRLTSAERHSLGP